MATPNVVPRADQEGGLGTAAKSWGKLFIENPTSGGTSAATISNLDVDEIALDINATANTTGNVIDISTSSLTTGKGLYLGHGGNSLESAGRLFHIYHLDGSPNTQVTTSNEMEYRTTISTTGTSTKTNLELSMLNVGSGNSGTINYTGLNNNLAISNNGGIGDNNNITQIGIHNTILLGTVANNVGLYSEVADGGMDVKFVSTADTGDYFSIATGAAGATTITTVDDDGAAAHLTFDIDGNFLIDSSTGTTYWYLNGNTADYASFVIGADGDFTFTTVDAAAAAANLTFNIDGDFIINSTDFSVNGTGTITDGEWGGGIIGVEYGGTGAGSFTDNAVLTGTGTSAITAEADLSFTSETLTIGADDNGSATIERKTHGDEAGGDLIVKAGNATGTDKAGGNLVLKAGAGTGTGDTTTGGSVDFVTAIPTSSGTGQQSITYPTAKFQSIANNNQFLIYEPGTVQTDYFRINVQASGATTISTVDAASSGANLDFSVDGTTKIVSKGVEIENASDSGTAALLIDNDDVDQVALDIDANNTTADIIDVVSSTLTTGSILKGTVTNSSTALTNAHAFADFNWTKSGNTGDGESYIITGQSIEIVDLSSSNHANSTVTQKGLDILVDSSSTTGTNTNTGIEIDVTDATTNYGLDITAEDGAGADIILRSSADDGDTFSIATGAAGATTLTTTDDDGETAHLSLIADGNILADSVGDITLDAASKQTYIAFNGTNYMNFDINNMHFKIMSLANQNDYFTMAVGAEGATTLTTVDADTSAAHFEIAADGHIVLDAAGDVGVEADGGDFMVGTGSVTYFTFKLDSTPEIDVVGDFKLDGTGVIEIESGTSHDIRLDAGDDIDIFAEDTIHLVSEGGNALVDRVQFGKTDGANLVQRTSFGAGMHRLQFTIVFNLATTGTDNTVYYEVPLAKIPAYSHIVKASAVVETQSTVSTFNANISLSSTSGTSLGQAAAGTVQEIIGAGNSDTRSSDSGSPSDIAFGAGAAPRKVWWMYGSGVTVGSSDMYIYLLNAGTNNNGTSSRGHVHCTIDYYGID
jgi:hypothetical protein